LKKKLGETENEVYTLQELCSNDKDLLKMLKTSNSIFLENNKQQTEDFETALLE